MWIFDKEIIEIKYSREIIEINPKHNPDGKKKLSFKSFKSSAARDAYIMLWCIASKNESEARQYHMKRTRESDPSTNSLAKKERHKVDKNMDEWMDGRKKENEWKKRARCLTQNHWKKLADKLIDYEWLWKCFQLLSL